MTVNPLAEAAGTVGDRWTLQVIAALLEGPKRFNELADHVEGIAPTVLSQRLKHLEKEGVVVATPYTRRPPRFSYDLSASGKELAGALRLLTQWGVSHHGEGAEPLSHRRCGTALEARWYCPTCGEPVEDATNEDDLAYV
jgi:DNA-binding HxlR family transcriptional regulator